MGNNKRGNEDWKRAKMAQREEKGKCKMVKNQYGRFSGMQIIRITKESREKM
jgi:hypothetical protein